MLTRREFIAATVATPFLGLAITSSGDVVPSTSDVQRPALIELKPGDGIIVDYMGDELHAEVTAVHIFFDSQTIDVLFRSVEGGTRGSFTARL